MSLRARLKQWLCPQCIEMEAGHARRARTVSILERSSDSLDRIAARMANDPNPFLGEPPRRIERREESR